METLSNLYKLWMKENNKPKSAEWRDRYHETFSVDLYEFNKNIYNKEVGSITQNELQRVINRFDNVPLEGVESMRFFLYDLNNQLFMNNSSKLDNLYTYLITNRRHVRYDWFLSYKEIYTNIQKVKEQLEKGGSLSDDKSYDGTIWKNQDKFLDRLLNDKNNGVSSSGQSNIGQEKYNAAGLFKDNPEFIDSIVSCIIEPDFDSFQKLEQAWLNQIKLGREKGLTVYDNKLLYNRVIAACTLEVSSTVDVPRFNTIFDHFNKTYFDDSYTGDDNWFQKNIWLVQKVRENLSHYPSNESEIQDDDIWLSIFIWEAYDFISKPFDLKRQVIKYGAPGTGKTYNARKEAKLQFNIWKEQYHPNYSKSFEEHLDIVQFHPSFSYEDFLEGLRPVPNNENGSIELKLCNGVFKKFCKDASRWEVDLYKAFGDNIPFHSFTIGDFLEDEKGAQLVELEYWAYVEDIEDQSVLLVNVIPPFFFIIDEINRAELSRVLGELMFSLENRGVDGKIKTQYTRLNDENTELLAGGEFFIPQNVFVIGTMNTIDRSVESFDFALRRRFYWEKVMPNASVVKYKYQEDGLKWDSLIKGWESLNDKIKKHPLLGEDYQVGHSYLLNLPYPKETESNIVKDKVWERTIAPLLEEYLRGTGNDIKEFRDVYFKGE